MMRFLLLGLRSLSQLSNIWSFTEPCWTFLSFSLSSPFCAFFFLSLLWKDSRNNVLTVVKLLFHKQLFGVIGAFHQIFVIVACMYLLVFSSAIPVQSNAGPQGQHSTVHVFVSLSCVFVSICKKKKKKKFLHNLWLVLLGPLDPVLSIILCHHCFLWIHYKHGGTAHSGINTQPTTAPQHINHHRLQRPPWNMV